jgi:hypothetical protein
MLSLLPSKALADFGDADIKKDAQYDAYCGKKGNDCKLKFENDTIVVNSASSVNKNQIFNYTTLSRYDGGCLFGDDCDAARRIHSIDIDYVKDDGSRSTARILFVNNKSYLDFMSTLRSFTGFASSGEFDPRCPSGGRFYRNECMSAQQINNVRQQSAEAWRSVAENLNEQQERSVERQNSQPVVIMGSPSSGSANVVAPTNSRTRVTCSPGYTNAFGRYINPSCDSTTNSW